MPLMYFSGITSNVTDSLVSDRLAKGWVLVKDAKNTAVAAAEKPLSKMNRADLDAIVAAEGVDIGDATTNKAIVAKIEANHTSSASPAATADTE
jgi:hypothetical protein